jgi:hypothetical protein
VRWSVSRVPSAQAHSTTTSTQLAHPVHGQIEDSGQHEVLNWFCLLGAMEELGRKPDRSTFIESWAFVSPVVFAHYNP